MDFLAIYPGTFDPITFGHLDVIARAVRIFDRLTVAVAANGGKDPLFSLEERVNLLRQSVIDHPTVEVDSFDGLLVDYARLKNVQVLIRGVRAFSDFEYEFQMALINRKMASDVETVYLMPKEEYSYISSSMVREIAMLGGPIDHFVPSVVQKAIEDRLST